MEQPFPIEHPLASAPSTPSPAPSARPWRCRACGSLLGVLRGGELHLKYKDVQHWIVGRCRHVCRRCGATNVVHVADCAPGAGGAR
jgi:hypothetical protein